MRVKGGEVYEKMRVRAKIVERRHGINLVVDERGGLLCKKSVGKFLLPLLPIFLTGIFCGCTQVVTLPVRTVIDLTERPITIETGSTIDLLEQSRGEKEPPRSPADLSPEKP